MELYLLNIVWFAVGIPFLIVGIILSRVKKKWQNRVVSGEVVEIEGALVDYKWRRARSHNEVGGSWHAVYEYSVDNEMKLHTSDIGITADLKKPIGTKTKILYDRYSGKVFADRKIFSILATAMTIAGITIIALGALCFALIP